MSLSKQTKKKSLSPSPPPRKKKLKQKNIKVSQETSQRTWPKKISSFLLWLLTAAILGIGTVVTLWFWPVTLIEVPELAGTSKQESIQILKELGFHSFEFIETTSDEPVDMVLKTNPAGGTPVKTKDNLKIIISSGDIGEIKDYRGENIKIVTRDLEKIYHLKKDQIKIHYEYGNLETKNKIIRQSPLGKLDFKSGVIEFWVSKGPEFFTIGNYHNEPVEKVTETLLDMGIPDDRIEIVYINSKATAPGYIVDNEPKDNTLPIDSSEKVLLKVSKSSKIRTQPMPNLIGLTYEEAMQKLLTLGFKESHITFGGLQDTEVKRQSIAPGKPVYPPYTFVTFEMTPPVGMQNPIEQLNMSSLIKMPVSTAIQTLNSLGIAYEIDYVPSRTYDQVILDYELKSNNVVHLEVAYKNTSSSSNTSPAPQPATPTTPQVPNQTTPPTESERPSDSSDDQSHTSNTTDDSSLAE